MHLTPIANNNSNKNRGNSSNKRHSNLTAVNDDMIVFEQPELSPSTPDRRHHSLTHNLKAPDQTNGLDELPSLAQRLAEPYTPNPFDINDDETNVLDVRHTE